MMPRGGKTEMNDELEALVVSKKELDRKLLADILSPYVRLDRDDCDIDTLEAWLGLGTDLKILVYLLARKAMVALGFDLGVEGATAREVAMGPVPMCGIMPRPCRTCSRNWNGRCAGRNSTSPRTSADTRCSARLYRFAPRTTNSMPLPTANWAAL